MRIPKLLSTIGKVAIAALAAHFLLPYLIVLGNAEWIHFSIVAVIHLMLDQLEIWIE